MAKLVDMKRTAADKKAEDARYSGKSISGTDDYPYGLEVSLDHHSLSKLGMEGPLPKVGTKIPLTAHAHVKSTSETVRDGKKTRRMELELRHMALGNGESSDSEEETKSGMKGALDAAIGSEDGRKIAKK